MKMEPRMEPEEVYEVAVIGAGVIGSITAYYFASKGTKPVLLLEQVNISSHIDIVLLL